MAHGVYRLTNDKVGIIDFVLNSVTALTVTLRV